ncbi:MAG: 5'/3'-nucleotidase SurE [Acidobacteria bacterium]|nr:5'/3'-nucleotidase SurE [Acidobacteriota bacterium]
MKSSVPNILITNDDGIHADGLLALEEALQEMAAVWVVAPLGEMSASSHSISLQRPVRYEELSERKFAVEGTPADAVIMALNKLVKVEPDLVIAGINRGGNMGENVFYSGTVAAGFEAVLNHIPAFAISVASRSDFRFDVAAAFAVKLTEKLLREPLPAGLLLNVNVPVPWRNGVRLTRQSQKISKNLLVENIDPRGRKYFWMHEQVDLSQMAPDTDYAAIRDGSISITPLHADRTEHQAVQKLADWVQTLNHFAVAADLPRRR